MIYNRIMDHLLKQQELTATEVLNHLTDGIIVTDPDGMILFCNPIAASNYGVPKTKLTGSSIESLLEKGFIDQSFWSLAASTQKTITYEQICRSKKRLINKTIPVKNKKGHICYIIEQTYCVKELAFDSNSQISDSPVLAESAETQRHGHSDPLMANFKSPAMIQVYHLADNMAPKNINILILGASGTGKTRLAKRIHDNSPRKKGPFITINCSTIPENLLESELFGYMKGAFSGASDRGKQGLVELSDGGTLFLDEIGEIPLSTQVKLLQLVQEKTYLPIGSIHPKQVDTRIIAATNKDLHQQVKNGVFREDLFYRLAVVTITMPSLGSRPEDIKRLLYHFTHIFNHKHNTDISFSKNTVELLTHYSWPGNIRELEHLVEFLILNASEEYITPYMLPANILNASVLEKGKDTPKETPRHNNGFIPEEPHPHLDGVDEFDDFNSLQQFLEHCESIFIRKMHESYDTSYKLAERLKISQSKASRLIRKYLK